MKALATILSVTFLAVLATQAAPTAYLGVQAVPVNPALAEHLGLPAGVGLTVVEVDPEGALAERLKPNDVLQKLDGQVLVNMEQLQVLVRNKAPGDKVTLTSIHKGRTKKMAATLKEKDLPKISSRKSGPRWQHGRMPPLSMDLDQETLEGLAEEFQKGLGEMLGNADLRHQDIAAEIQKGLGDLLVNAELRHQDMVVEIQKSLDEVLERVELGPETFENLGNEAQKHLAEGAQSFLNAYLDQAKRSHDRAIAEAQKAGASELDVSDMLEDIDQNK